DNWRRGRRAWAWGDCTGAGGSGSRGRVGGQGVGDSLEVGGEEVGVIEALGEVDAGGFGEGGVGRERDQDVGGVGGKAGVFERGVNEVDLLVFGEVRRRGDAAKGIGAIVGEVDARGGLDGGAVGAVGGLDLKVRRAGLAGGEGEKRNGGKSETAHGRSPTNSGASRLSETNRRCIGAPADGR